MPRQTDPFWQYCTPCTEEINKVPCPQVTPKIQAVAKAALEDIKEKKPKRAVLQTELASPRVRGLYAEGSSSQVPIAEGSSGQEIISSNVPVPSMLTPCLVPNIKSMKKQMEKSEVDQLVSRCLLWADIPFNIAKNNPFYQPMFDAVAVVGPGYKAPSYEELRGPLIQNEKKECIKRLQDLRKSWAKTGCTIISDGWMDKKGKTMINFVVSCPRGTMFLKSIDASSHVKDAHLLCSLLEECILDVGVEHVAQVITSSAINFVAAGKMLMEKYPTLIWSSCVAYCIDLILEDLNKLEFVKSSIENAKIITKFIYNHGQIHSMMRQFTNNTELYHPTITWFATNFVTLLSIHNQMYPLKRLFVSEEWCSSPFSERTEGKQIYSLIFNDSFWKSIKEVVAVSEPLLKVLCLVNGNKPAMAYLYEAMVKAKEAIKNFYFEIAPLGVEDKHVMIWDIIDQRLDNMLYCPIHAAGAVLNPSLYYSESFDCDGELMVGFFTCLERMVPDSKTRLSIMIELEAYKRAQGLFGFEIAIQGRGELMPDVWWDNFGAETPNLRRFAIRVVSQVCSASSCERNWSVFEKIHSKKHNLSEYQRLNDTAFVYYNLRLWEKQLQQERDIKAIIFDHIDPVSDLIVETENPVMAENPSWLDDPIDEEDPSTQQVQEMGVLSIIGLCNTPTKGIPNTSTPTESAARAGPSTLRGRKRRRN